MNTSPDYRPDSDPVLSQFHNARHCGQDLDGDSHEELAIVVPPKKSPFPDCPEGVHEEVWAVQRQTWGAAEANDGSLHMFGGTHEDFEDM